MNEEITNEGTLSAEDVFAQMTDEQLDSATDAEIEALMRGDSSTAETLDNAEETTDDEIKEDEIKEDEIKEDGIDEADEADEADEKDTDSENADDETDEADKDNEADEVDKTDEAAKDDETDKEKSVLDTIKDSVFIVQKNGKKKEIKLDEIKNLSQVIQRGLGFGKNRQVASRNEKLVSSMANNGIKSEQDINLMIAAFNGDKDAIQSLMVKNELDIDKFDNEVNTEYNPKDAMYSSNSVEVMQILSEHSDNNNYDELVDIVKSKFNDNSGKNLKFIAENPDFIDMLQSHLSDGFYDTAMARVKDVRNNNWNIPPEVSDSQIYYTEVSNAMEAQRNQAKAKQTSSRKTINKSKVKDSFKSNKKAASSTTPVKKILTQEDYANMTDEELFKDD